ncbi:hypothetical protein MHBO_001784 [Bonamia ostreae]|uniref:Uncharacterized protein n=1 Tax=Bonamia ostreae TaxID=126728 RepID=A0ABV2AK53_9EUKA
MGNIPSIREYKNFVRDQKINKNNVLKPKFPKSEELENFVKTNESSKSSKHKNSNYEEEKFLIEI